MADETTPTPPSAGGRPAPLSDQNKLLAAIGYPIWIVALIMALTDTSKQDPFVKFHAWQALFLGIAGFVIAIVPFIGWLAWMVIFVMQIYYAIQAYGGKYFEVPVIYGLAKKQIEG